MKRFLTIGLLLVSICASATSVYQSIKLQHRSADTMQSMLMPLLPKHCSVSGANYQLLLRCDPQQMQQLTDLVHQLDQPQQNLMIRFKQLRNADYNAEQEADDAIKTYSTQPEYSQMQERNIEVQDGSEAYIALGQSFPYQRFFVGLFGVGFEQYDKNVMSGLIVTPEVHGNQVSLAITWKFDNLERTSSNWERRHRGIKQANTSTKINIPLGEWVDMSQYGSKSYTTPDARVYDTSDVTDPQTHLLIRVDLIT